MRWMSVSISTSGTERRLIRMMMKEEETLIVSRVSEPVAFGLTISMGS